MASSEREGGVGVLNLRLMGKKTASCRVIQESDLPDVLDSDTSEANLRKFQALWEQEKARASKVYDKTA